MQGLNVQNTNQDKNASQMKPLAKLSFQRVKKMLEIAVSSPCLLRLLDYHLHVLCQGGRRDAVDCVEV